MKLVLVSSVVNSLINNNDFFMNNRTFFYSCDDFNIYAIIL